MEWRDERGADESVDGAPVLERAKSKEEKKKKIIIIIIIIIIIFHYYWFQLDEEGGGGRERTYQSNGQESISTMPAKEGVDGDVLRLDPSKKREDGEAGEEVSGEEVPHERASGQVQKPPVPADSPAVRLARVRGRRVVVEGVEKRHVDEILRPYHGGGPDQEPPRDARQPVACAQGCDSEQHLERPVEALAVKCPLRDQNVRRVQPPTPVCSLSRADGLDIISGGGEGGGGEFGRQLGSHFHSSSKRKRQDKRGGGNEGGRMTGTCPSYIRHHNNNYVLLHVEPPRPQVELYAVTPINLLVGHDHVPEQADGVRDELDDHRRHRDGGKSQREEGVEPGPDGAQQ